jgi:hypothetical protein
MGLLVARVLNRLVATRLTSQTLMAGYHYLHYIQNCKKISIGHFMSTAAAQGHC